MDNMYSDEQEVKRMVKILTENGKVVGVELGGKMFHTKKPVPFREMERYSGALDTIEELIDFSGKRITANVTAEVMDAFVLNMYPKTIEYLTLLLSEERWFTAAEIKEKLEIKSQGIAGCRTSLSKRAKNLGIEEVDEWKWDQMVGAGEYRVKRQYREQLKKALGLP